MKRRERGGVGQKKIFWQGKGHWAYYIYIYIYIYIW